MRVCFCCLVVSPCCWQSRRNSSPSLLPATPTHFLHCQAEGRRGCRHTVSLHHLTAEGPLPSAEGAGPGSSPTEAMWTDFYHWTRWVSPVSWGKLHLIYQSVAEQGDICKAVSTYRLRCVFSELHDQALTNVGDTSLQWSPCAHRSQTMRTVGPKAKNIAGAALMLTCTSVITACRGPEEHTALPRCCSSEPFACILSPGFGFMLNWLTPTMVGAVGWSCCCSLFPYKMRHLIILREFYCWMSEKYSAAVPVVNLLQVGALTAAQALGYFQFEWNLFCK